MNSLLCALLFVSGVALAQALPASPYVQVTGHGSLSVVPDMARVTVSVAETGKDLAATRATVEQRASAVLAAARRLGVAERDLDAGSLAIQPEYRWENNSQVFIGQQVSRRIAITLRDLKRYPELISALVKAGVTTFSTTLDHSDIPALRRQVLAQAVDDAHARAQALAAAAGTALGGVYSISANDVFSRPQPLLLAAKAAAANGGADYTPGTLDIDATVNVVYLLKSVQ
ncbi:MAG: SIMPL domain-containing protein [Gammaproteobacteria bacterium]